MVAGSGESERAGEGVVSWRPLLQRMARVADGLGGQTGSRPAIAACNRPRESWGGVGYKGRARPLAGGYIHEAHLTKMTQRDVGNLKRAKQSRLCERAHSYPATLGKRDAWQPCKPAPHSLVQAH
jgi:hypothetical protein